MSDRLPRSPVYFLRGVDLCVAGLALCLLSSFHRATKTVPVLPPDAEPDLHVVEPTKVTMPTDLASLDVDFSSPRYAEDLTDQEVRRLIELIADNKSDEIEEQQAIHLVAHLRRRYPFISIRNRLPVLKPRNERRPVLLNDEAKQDLEAYEIQRRFFAHLG